MWCAVGGGDVGLAVKRRVPYLGRLLEEAFDAVAADWLDLASTLGREPSSELAHAPAAATNVSDLGLMLAWSQLIDRWGRESSVVLVVCDDPWLFRHLMGRPGVTAAAPPGLHLAEIRWRLRGFVARVAVAVRSAIACLALSHQRSRLAPGGAWLLVYGHPGSDKTGGDAYFGSLLQTLPGLKRLLHIDCQIERARELSRHRSTVSLHAWGSISAAARLVLARWHVTPVGPYRWLIRRASVLEGGTGQGAALRWQIICQDNWLRHMRPAVIAWPWENHSWERALVRRARACGVHTIGYQHATVAWREWNYSPRSNSDGESSLPDRVLCSGEAGFARLRQYGFPAAKMEIGGALRFSGPGRPRFDAAAPIFVATPSDAVISAEMLAAIRPLGASGRHFIVKDHPLSPFSFAESPGVERSRTALGAQTAVSAVLYCGTSVGLEAVLAGLPVLRFRPASRVPVDVIPQGISVPAADADELGQALDRLRTADGAFVDVFAQPELAVWRNVLLAPAAVTATGVR